MDANKILSSDLLDIVFESRNKAYGAYELRRKYKERLTLALLFTGGLGMIVFLASFLHDPGKGRVKYQARVVELIEIKPDDKVIEDKVEPEKKKPEQVKTEDYTKPLIMKNQDVKDNEMPPPVDSLMNAVIGTEKKEGSPDDGTKPAEPGEGEGTAPVKTIDAPPAEDKPLTMVEIEAEFPGGNQAWSKYISQAIYRNIDELQDEGKSGTVVLQFVVDTDGTVSDVKLIPCQLLSVSTCLERSKLADIALAAVRKGPRWTPAVQNGRPVKAYRKQAVTFRLEQE